MSHRQTPVYPSPLYGHGFTTWDVDRKEAVGSSQFATTRYTRGYSGLKNLLKVALSNALNHVK